MENRETMPLQRLYYHRHRKWILDSSPQWAEHGRDVECRRCHGMDRPGH